MHILALTGLVAFATSVTEPAEPAGATLAPIVLALELTDARATPAFDLQLLRDEPATPGFGDKGSTRFTIQAVGGAEGGDNHLVGGGFGFEHFFADGLGLVTQFNGLSALQDGPDAAGASLTLLLRWHWLVREGWTVYSEAGAGVAWFTDDVPAGGSRFNFTPQAATGVTFDVGEGNRAYVAVGWHHVSNAQIFDTNPGRDSVVVHAGLSIPF